LPWASAALWSAALAVAVWGATGWGIQGPQQYRLVNVAPATAPILLGLNTAATYLGVTAAGVVGAAGIHWIGARHPSCLSAGISVLAIRASRLAGRRTAGHAARPPAAELLPARP